MTTSDWYKVLIENVTMIEDESGMKIEKLPKIEERQPDVDWNRTWEIFNTKGLRRDNSTFLLKLLYNILPTKSRLFRMNVSDSSLCELCSEGITEDLKQL